jgi:hypothetical protein
VLVVVEELSRRVLVLVLVRVLVIKVLGCIWVSEGSSGPEESEGFDGSTGFELPMP